MSRNYIRLTDNFEYSELCYCSYPCQHNVIIDNQYNKLNGIDIYQYCVENNIDIPEHFEDYKEGFLYKFYSKIIEHGNLDEFIKNNELLNNKKYFSRFLCTACMYNKIDIVNHLLSLGATITNEVLENCIKSNNIKLFKQLYSEQTKSYDNILNIAAKYDNMIIIKYLIEDCGFKLTNNCGFAIAYALENKNIELSKYLEQLSIEQRIIFTGTIAEKLDGKINDKLIHKNSGITFSASLNNKLIQDDDDILNRIQNNVIRTSLNGLIYNKYISGLDKLWINLPGTASDTYYLKEIEIKINCNNNITKISLNFNGSTLDFNKIDNNTYKVVFDNPINYYYDCFTDKHIIFLGNKLNINEMHFSFHFLTGPKINYKMQYKVKIGPNVEYVSYGGSGIFDFK